MFFVAALLLAAALWEVYKQFGPDGGGRVLGWTVLPRSNDTAMPHVWEMFRHYTKPDRRGSDREVWQVVLAGAWYSFRLALLGFALGVTVGLGLAILMARFRVVERGLLPVPGRLADRPVDRAGAARRELGWQGRKSATGCGRAGCRHP